MKYLNFEQFKAGNILGTGESNKVFDQYFTGQSFLNPLTQNGDSVLFLSCQCDI